MLCHRGGRLIVPIIPLCPGHSCRGRRLQNLLSGPWLKQPMELHNLSSPSPSPSSSVLPPSFPPSPSSTPSAFTTVGESSEGLCHPTSSSLVSAFLAPILALEFVLGLVGNSLAFFIFCVHTRPWTSNTVFLVSLVAADFLLISNLPLRVDYYLLQEIWRFGAPACKINLFMLSTNRTASVVFLTAIALNRYLKVVRPHHALSRASVGAAARVAGGLWVGILLLNGHLLLSTFSGPSCLSYRVGTKPSASLRWHQALYLLEFFLPLALILFAIVSIGLTIRNRGLGGQAGPQRAMRVLAVVVAVYTICFLPSIIFGMASMVAFWLSACRSLDVCTQLFHGSLAFTYLNSVLDPVLYCFSSPNFLHQSRALLGLTRGRQGPVTDESSYQPSREWRHREASRKAEAIGKLEVQAKVSLEKEGSSQG
ncbi:oxoeicosanoid receptor 1 [Chlorocebus sabaeus]|uniref:oxoeicosanoid receptor 1 n=1 Tax=Chlorocebus sabaeus TaxID=60711 RepID=UPI003BFA353C